MADSGNGRMGEGRRLVRDVVLAVALACAAAYTAYILGLRGPSFLVVGAALGLALFALLQWGDKLVARTGYLESPVTFRRPRWHPPRWAGKGRLRRDTMALVKEIHAYVQAQPSAAHADHLSWQTQTREMRVAKDEDERQAIWEKYTAKSIEQNDRERQELAQRFGGQIQALVDRYQQRGKLDNLSKAMLRWEPRALRRLPDVAETLEALARQL